MKYRIAFLAMALTLFAERTFAQSVSTPVSRAALAAAGIPASAGELTVGVQALLRSADQTGGPGGVRFCREAVKMARQEHHLPSFTSWRLANRYFADGDTLRAISVLDGLANEAAAQGDIGVEALAIHYSAWLNGQAGRAPEFTTRMEKLQKLLQSQYMPVAVRDDINDRLNGVGRVATNP